jgi:hypothetical protein
VRTTRIAANPARVYTTPHPTDLPAHISKVGGGLGPAGVSWFPLEKDAMHWPSLVLSSPSTYDHRASEGVMFLHSGPRTLWPVIFFLPWFFLGSAYLLESALHRRWSMRLPSTGTRYPVSSSAGRLRTVGLGLFIGLGLLLMTASLALADPVPEGRTPCPVTTQGEARKLADRLFEEGAYQSAGECYQAAGEYALANRAFVKALGPQSTVTASELSEQRDQAKMMLRKVQQAFHAEH